jgi:hypothetical protein
MILCPDHLFFLSIWPKTGRQPRIQNAPFTPTVSGASRYLQSKRWQDYKKLQSLEPSSWRRVHTVSRERHNEKKSETMKINRRDLLSLLGVSPALLASPGAQEQRTKTAIAPSPSTEQKLEALNPKGSPPAVRLVPMAPRLDTLNGKTVYLVDTGFMGGGTLLQQMQIWFNKNMPEVTAVFRKKAGSYPEEDPALWKEIKEKGNAAIMAIGH